MAIIGSLCLGFGITILGATAVLYVFERNLGPPTPEEAWLFRKPSEAEFW